MGKQILNIHTEVHIFHCALTPHCQEGASAPYGSIDEGNVLQNCAFHLNTGVIRTEVHSEEAAMHIYGRGLGVHIENGVALSVKGAGEGYGCIVGVCNAVHINVIDQHITTGGIFLHNCRECLQIFSSADCHRIKFHIHGNIHRLLAIAEGQVQGLLTAERLNRCTVQSYHTVSIACRSKGSAVYRSAGQGIALQCAVVVAQVDGEVLPCAVSAHCKGIANHKVFLCAVYIVFSGIKVICGIGQHCLQCIAAGVLAVHTGDVVHGAVADTQTVSAVGNNNLSLGVHSLRIQIRCFHIEHSVLFHSFTGFTVAGVGIASAAANGEIEPQSDLAAENHTDTVKVYTV